MPTSATPQTPPADVAAVRRRLARQLQERQDLLRELEPRALPTVDPVAYQTAVSHRRIVDAITAAIARLDGGTYGRCSHCRGPIAPGRLEALPYADACIECQSRHDAA